MPSNCWLQVMGELAAPNVPTACPPLCPLCTCPSLQHWPKLTTAFLAGALPIALAVGCLAYWRLRRIWRVAMLFERWTPQLPRREVHR